MVIDYVDVSPNRDANYVKIAFIVAVGMAVKAKLNLMLNKTFILDTHFHPWSL